ncbi:MAG TPA: (2Fe-2S)-binding protein [Ktedonobacteraceae bacterium]|nr:(2Fe-2S)-binding protein [Ktedonobacteraceae bacterium]
MQITLTVNGEQKRVDIEPRMLLVDCIRDTLDLTGTKVGCDTGYCGACTIQVNGRSVKSCLILAVQANGSDVRTIEGVAGSGQLTALQEGFWEKHGLQCGFCTPGMIMSLLDLLQYNKNPEEDEIRTWLEGNLCRCTGYQNIISAVRYASERMQQAPAAEPTSTSTR